MKRTLIAMSLVTVSSLALAQGPALPVFADLDADGNGSVSLAELQAVIPFIMEEAFTAADVDGSGELSEEEFTALLSAAGPPAGGGGAPPGGAPPGGGPPPGG